MKRLLIAAGILAAAVLLVTACNPSSGSGVMELSITDAPLMASDVNGVFITVEEIHYNTHDGGWNTLDDFKGPQTFDLLALNSGNSLLLGELSLPAGDYTQIRFMLGAPDEEEGSPSSPGSWIEKGDNDTYDADTDSTLFVPSGAQTGYKASTDGYFTVPVNGSVAITADFDLRRAVVKLGATERYILKPVLRLVVDNEAGMIAGEITETTTLTAGSSYVVHAYESGAYSDSESSEPTTDDGTRFANAVTSSELAEVAGENNDYVLAYLAAGNYDLHVAEYDTGGNFIEVEVLGSEMIVTSGETTTYDITDMAL